MPPKTRNVLIVHPDIGALTVFQGKFVDAGLSPTLARDLPTALLAMAHHRFELCVVASKIAEDNDGWALAAVLHMCFPSAFVAVLVPNLDILTYQAAINSGTNEVYRASASPANIAEKLLHDLAGRFNPETGRVANIQ